MAVLIDGSGTLRFENTEGLGCLPHPFTCHDGLTVNFWYFDVHGASIWPAIIFGNHGGLQGDVTNGFLIRVIGGSIDLRLENSTHIAEAGFTLETFQSWILVSAVYSESSAKLFCDEKLVDTAYPREKNVPLKNKQPGIMSIGPSMGAKFMIDDLNIWFRAIDRGTFPGTPYNNF